MNVAELNAGYKYGRGVHFGIAAVGLWKGRRYSRFQDRYCRATHQEVSNDKFDFAAGKPIQSPSTLNLMNVALGKNPELHAP